jgi:hypothetical protein
MIHRILIAATLVATLAPTVGGARAQGLDAKNVTVTNVNINPSTLSSNGGPVTVTFRIKRAKRVNVRGVTVFAKVKGRNGLAVPATSQGNDTYTANVTVGGNTGNSAITATLFARIRHNKGTNNRKLGNVRVNAPSNDPTQPPPPPPI